MRLFKNEKIRKVLISALCILTMLAVSIPVYAIQEMEDAEKAYFLTYDELYWFIGSRSDSLGGYAKERFNAIEHMLNDRDNDGLTIIATRCYQMIKARGLEDPYESTTETTTAAP